MNDLFCDIGYHSLNKDGETLCGDRVQCVSPNEETRSLCWPTASAAG